MKKYIATILILNFTLICFSQSTKTSTVRYVYSQCTIESKKELYSLLKNDLAALKVANKKHFDICNDGKIILSTKQYEPILKVINSQKSNNNMADEQKIFSEISKEKYVLVTDLIEK